MNDDQRLLAHAAIDGELTAEEQARAEADPEVLAELERLRAVRAGLRAVDPLPPARRQTLLAAALDDFDTGAPVEAAPRVVAPPPPSLAARRRARWLLPAAAAVLVGVAAVGAIVGTGGDDSGEESSDATTASPAGTDMASPELAATAVEESTGAADGDVMFGTVLVDDQLGTASLVVVRNPDELAAYAADAARSADLSSQLTADAPATSAPADVVVEATTGGTTAVARTEAADSSVVAGAAVGPTCPVDGEYLGTVSYGSEPETAVVVDVVRRGDVVLALAVEGCVEVAVAAGP